MYGRHLACDQNIELENLVGNLTQTGSLCYGDTIQQL